MEEGSGAMGRDRWGMEEGAGGHGGGTAGAWRRGRRGMEGRGVGTWRRGLGAWIGGPPGMDRDRRGIDEDRRVEDVAPSRLDPHRRGSPTPRGSGGGGARSGLTGDMWAPPTGANLSGPITSLDYGSVTNIPCSHGLCGWCQWVVCVVVCGVCVCGGGGGSGR